MLLANLQKKVGGPCERDEFGSASIDVINELQKVFGKRGPNQLDSWNTGKGGVFMGESIPKRISQKKGGREGVQEDTFSGWGISRRLIDKGSRREG